LEAVGRIGATRPGKFPAGRIPCTGADGPAAALGAAGTAPAAAPDSGAAKGTTTGCKGRGSEPSPAVGGAGNSLSHCSISSESLARTSVLHVSLTREIVSSPETQQTTSNISARGLANTAW